MATTQKALEIMAAVKAELAARFAGYALALSYDTDGSPVLLVGDNTATHMTFQVKVKPIDWALSYDIIGHSSPVYTPHEILVGWEAVSGAGAEPLSAANKLALLGTLLGQGCRVSVYESATGDSFDLADFVVANLKGTYESIKYPMVSSQ
jgi:hypothetical protein